MRSLSPPSPAAVGERLLPGDGSFDLVGLVRTLDRIGCRAPIGVEVYSDALATLPVDEIARTTADATRRVLDRARRDG